MTDELPGKKAWRGFLSDYFLRKYLRAEKDNEKNVLTLLEPSPGAALLDLGCGNGSWTMRVAECIGTNNISGIELRRDESAQSVKRGINVVMADLNRSFPFSDNTFDVIHSNQVIEHLTDVDGFISETHRVLKTSGYIVISTENLSSFENLISLALGQQAFSQHISRRFTVGNIFSPHFGDEVKEKEMTHKTIFTLFGLRRLLEAYGFMVKKAFGAGYFPLPNRLAHIDPIHARFIAMKARKRAGHGTP